jgi:hypothetical protein
MNKKNIILIILTIISLALTPFYFIGLIPLTAIIIYYFLSKRKEGTHILRKYLWAFPIISNILFFYVLLAPLSLSSAGTYWIWGLIEIKMSSHATFILGNFNTLFLAIPTVSVLLIVIILNIFTGRILKVGETNSTIFRKKWLVYTLISIHLHVIVIVCNWILSAAVLNLIGIGFVFLGFGMIMLLMSLVFSILGFFLYLIYRKKGVLVEQVGLMSRNVSISLILVLTLLGLLFGTLLGGGYIFYPYPDIRTSVIIAGTIGIIVSTGSIIFGIPGMIGKDKSKIKALISICLSSFILSYSIYLLILNIYLI